MLICSTPSFWRKLPLPLKSSEEKIAFSVAKTIFTGGLLKIKFILTSNQI
jgi:hypothetical protein